MIARHVFRNAEAVSWHQHMTHGYLRMNLPFVYRHCSLSKADHPSSRARKKGMNGCKRRLSSLERPLPVSRRAWQHSQLQRSSSIQNSWSSHRYAAYCLAQISGPPAGVHLPRLAARLLQRTYETLTNSLLSSCLAIGRSAAADQQEGRPSGNI